MSILIDVAAEFTGKKAFKQAESATDKLTKSAKSLAKTLGISFGTAAVLGYAKASVKAAADDQKAQKQLALALKNVGLERDAASAEGFIQRLQTEFGIVDDKLRPAYQKLAIATRDTVETQRLLNLSLDISAATGKDLDAVTGALSKAYLGNNTALSKLGVGISKADLKTKSFKDVTDQLATTFKGAATESANTFAGSMAKLGVASQNVKEIIGTGIIDALTSLGKDDSVSNLAKDMEAVALYSADAIRGVASLIQEIQKLPGIPSIKIGMIPVVGAWLDILSSRGKAARIAPKPFSTPMSISGQVQTPAAKTQLTISKATLKVSKDNLKLAKAKSIFDLQKIQIEAALKGKISEEERIRLKLMQAIQDENISQIDVYTKALSEVQAKVTMLQATLSEVYAMDVGNPFIAWEIGLDGVKRALIEVNGQSIELTNTIAQNSLAAGLAGGASFAQALSGARYAAKAAATAGISGATGVMPQVPAVGSGGTAGGGNNTVVQVTVQGSVIAENDLNQSINDALAKSGWAGLAVGYNRQAVITAI